MNIWLINSGEPLPGCDNNARLLRYGLLLPYLLQDGHNVTWWSSTFNHFTKDFRSKGDQSLQIESRFSIKLLDTIRYNKNVSLRRIVNHIILGKKLKATMHKEVKPDVILCSLPTIEMAFEAVKFACNHNIPVIVDLRDMWPDSFVEIMHTEIYKNITKTLLKPMFSKMHCICKNATSLIGITKGYLDWGLKYSGREVKTIDKVYPLACLRATLNEQARSNGSKFWEELGISKNNKNFIISFVGNFGNRLEIIPVIEAAKKLGSNFKFVLAGFGTEIGYYKELAKDLDNVIFPGWVNQEQVWTLLDMSKIGLAPYKSLKDFIISIPNKPIEYLSFGLPVVSCLGGVLENFLLENYCGITYKNNDFQSLIESIKILAENDEKYYHMSAQAKNAYDKFFNASLVYSDMANHVIQMGKMNLSMCA